MRFEKIEVSGLIVLFIGVALLAATFYSAYVFLVDDVTILTSVDLSELFGNALAPLIEAVIHILYLGVMGWIGSILTIRAVQLLKKDKEATTASTQPKPDTKQNVVPQTQPTQTKPEPQKDAKETKKTETQSTSSIAPQPAELQKQTPDEVKTEKPV